MFSILSWLVSSCSKSSTSLMRASIWRLLSVTILHISRTAGWLSVGHSVATRSISSSLAATMPCSGVRNSLQWEGHTTHTDGQRMWCRVVP